MDCIKDHTHETIRVISDGGGTFIVLSPSQARTLAYGLLNALHAPSPTDLLHAGDAEPEEKATLYTQADIDRTKMDLEELADNIEGGADSDDDPQLAILDRVIAYIGAMEPTAPLDAATVGEDSPEESPRERAS